MRILHQEATIYVPVEGSYHDTEIAPGSGIVGTENDDGKTILYYEGNLYGAVNLHDPSERVVCAFGRLATRYPTAAMMAVSRGEMINLIEVGQVFWPNRIQFNSETAKSKFEAYMARYAPK